MRKLTKAIELLTLLLLLSLIFSFFIRISIGSHCLDGADTLNIWYEKNHSQIEIDRTVLVKAVYDREYVSFCLGQKHYGLFWENGSIAFSEKWTTEEWIINVINRASKSFEYQFGIKLILVEIEEWHLQGNDSLSLIRELGRKIPLTDCDVVIAFSGRVQDLTSRAEMPHSGHLGNYVLLGNYFPKHYSIQWLKHIFNSYHIQSYVLTHEMGHIFGAVHPEEVYPEPASVGDFWNYTRKTFSIMNAATGMFTTHFDRYNREIILQNKYLPFK